jgi:hypothetical protein
VRCRALALLRMLYGALLEVESSMPPEIARTRIRELVATRQMVDAPRFRRRQIIGWRFKEGPNVFTLSPEYGDAASAYGTRFEGTVEERGAGSRVVGRVVLSRLSRVIMSIWFVAVAIAVSVALVQGIDPPLKVVFIAAIMIAAGVALVRYSVRSTVALVEAGLRAALQGA